MKALILAAGFGTRLQELYPNTAKPLIPVAGKPIINHILENLNQVEEVDEIYLVINNHYASQFQEWLLNNPNHKQITLFNNGVETNENRLGSIGDMQFPITQTNCNDDLMILGGDNILGFKLSDLVKTFNQTRNPIVAAYDVKNKEEAKKYGIIEVNNNIISTFIEKPAEPKSTLASTLAYIFPKEQLHLMKDYLDQGLSPDRSGDYIAWLLTKTKVNAFIFEGTWFDIGTPDQLKEASRKLQ